MFSLIAVYALAAAIGGWMSFVDRQVPIPFRVLLAVGGFMMFLPGLVVTLIGLAIVVVSAVVVRIMKPAPVIDPDTGQIARIPQAEEKEPAQ